MHIDTSGVSLICSRRRANALSEPSAKKPSIWWRSDHISTNEMYGNLERTVELFTESTYCAPGSPYSASKAMLTLSCMLATASIGCLS
ncbi:GDP-mannose 4,6-dehydratase [Pseudomonas sp. UBA6310]|uniref:GDP-mannose 4,6-dehydratase n=1 Tax=Pseudomonas sp. UBA6310 TaxID=1947327 RepID=UPI0039C8E492